MTAPPPLPPRAADTAAAFRAPTTITARAAPAAATSADRQKFAFGDGFADVLNEVAVGQALKDSHVADVKAPTYVAKPAPFDLARPDLTSKLTARKTLERLARDEIRGRRTSRDEDEADAAVARRRVHAAARQRPVRGGRGRRQGGHDGDSKRRGARQCRRAAGRRAAVARADKTGRRLRSLRAGAPLDERRGGPVRV